jgi:hypothetical protein
MTRKLWLSDTAIRIYRKKSVGVVLRLKSHLMIPTNRSFSFTHYCRKMAVRLILPNGASVEFCDLKWRDAADYVLDTMIYSFQARADADESIASYKAALFMMDYHISFTGHESEPPDRFEVVVPLVDRRLSDYSSRRQCAGAKSNGPAVHWALRGRTGFERRD